MSKQLPAIFSTYYGTPCESNAHRRTFLSKIIPWREIPVGMPVTKHKAASCRKFNVVAPRGRDKRGESFSQPLRILWPDSRVKAVYGTGKEKSKSTRLVLGKVQLVRFTLKQRGESRNRLNPRKARFFFLSFSFPLSFSPEGLPPPSPPTPGCILSLSLKNLIRHALFRFLSFRFASTSYSMAYFYFGLKLSSCTKEDREKGNAISKVFQDLDFWTSLRCWRRLFEGE